MTDREMEAMENALSLLIAFGGDLRGPFSEEYDKIMWQVQQDLHNCLHDENFYRSMGI